MIPDGDRRQTAESCGVVNEITASLVRYDDIVGVLVLNHDVRHHARRTLREAPHDDVVERAMREERRERFDLFSLQARTILELHGVSVWHKSASSTASAASILDHPA